MNFDLFKRKLMEALLVTGMVLQGPLFPRMTTGVSGSQRFRSYSSQHFVLDKEITFVTRVLIEDSRNFYEQYETNRSSLVIS